MAEGARTKKQTAFRLKNPTITSLKEKCREGEGIKGEGERIKKPSSDVVHEKNPKDHDASSPPL